MRRVSEIRCAKFSNCEDYFIYSPKKLTYSPEKCWLEDYFPFRVVPFQVTCYFWFFFGGVSVVDFFARLKKICRKSAKGCECHHLTFAFGGWNSKPKNLWETQHLREAYPSWNCREAIPKGKDCLPTIDFQVLCLDLLKVFGKKQIFHKWWWKMAMNPMAWSRFQSHLIEPITGFFSSLHWSLGWYFCKVSNVQNPVDIPLYSLFNKDSYNGLLQSPYNWVVHFFLYSK